MVEDFNNVQDQNLVDDDIANQIAGDKQAQGGQVGSVVHPDDPKPASQKPPTPTAQELLGDKIEQVAAEAKADNAAPAAPQPNQENAQPQQPAQEQHAQQSEQQSAPQPEDGQQTEEPKIEVPEPEISTEEKQEEAKKEEEKPEENFVPAPDDAVPADDSADETPADEGGDGEDGDNEDSGGDDDDDANEGEDQDDSKHEEDKNEDRETPKLDTSHLDGGTGDDDELAEVKQEALEELSPLIDHLDLPADQKFDTYMEILRASDDKTLVKPALEAARAIEDEDKRAQALLDVVNEVNYLTQPPEEAE